MTTNVLQQVATYNESGLALLLNSQPFIGTCNMKFKDFDKVEKNLGSSILLDQPSRFTSANTLIASFQNVEDKSLTLTVDQAANVSYEFSAQEFIFNAKDFMAKYGRDAIAELGTKVESDVASVCETTPYRFYGDGVTALSSYSQLATALAFFRDFGAAKMDTKAFLDNITIPSIVNSGLNQFTTDRGNKESMSWEIGDFSRCEWFESNLLPIHTAGSEGANATVLTVVSTGLDANGAVTSIVFSGTDGATDADSVKKYDSFQFSDGVAGKKNMRFMSYIGHKLTQSPVQFSATADAASTGGSQVTVTINPPLQAAAGAEQNTNTPIVAGMQVTVLPDHRCGLIMSGSPLYMAMPRLPEPRPFDSKITSDPDTGASMRTYFGSLFGQNQQGIVHDCIWGKQLAENYAMKLVIPV